MGGISGRADSAHAMCQKLTGDGTITARVKSIQAVGGTYQAGVMFRQTMNADSRFSYMYIPSSGYAYNFYRASPGGTVVDVRTSGNAPYWVRIVKEGNVYTSYRSSDGNSWSAVRSVTLQMGEAPYACLAASSRSSSKAGESVFD